MAYPSSMPKRSEVEDWLAAYDNPMKDVVLAIRDVVLATDPRVDECIKWKAPTFIFEGNIASFFPKSKKHASLMFHYGAQIPGDHPRLEGTGDTSRVLKLGSVEAVEAATSDLQAIVRAWIEWKEGDGGTASSKRAKKKVSRSKTTSGGSTVGTAKKTKAKKVSASKTKSKKVNASKKTR